MLCVGEKIEEREAGQTERGRACVSSAPGSSDARRDDASRDASIAYEPVWAIGTGTHRDAAGRVARCTRRFAPSLRELAGERAASIPILYGGSVNAANAAALLAAPGVDGLLVGGASLDAESWAAICSA